MLIDTNSVVQKTELRLKLAQVFDRVSLGETILISERGAIKAKISPFDEKLTTENENQLLYQVKKFASRLANKGFGSWNSLERIKKERQKRCKK